MAEAYIVAACRTAGGRRNGRLAGWHPADLAGKVLDELVQRTGLDPQSIDDVIMGCVGQGGEQSQNIGRNAVLSSSLPESVPATSIDRQCGSSQQAIHFAAQAVMSGTQDVVIAAGVESMSRVPMFSPSTLAEQAGMGVYVSPAMSARYPGVRFSQFTGAELIAEKYGFSREDMDAYSVLSHQKAALAMGSGRFEREILPVPFETPEGIKIHAIDEGVRVDATLESVSGVRLITEGGRISAAAASQICDGAAGVMIMSEAGLRRSGLTPLGRIHHLSVLGHDPVVMLEAPIPATRRALERAGMTIGDIDLFEINEAFASIPMAWLKALEADPDRLNVNGGAIALGHPLGASGARLMTTLMHALIERKGRYGLQAMCEGGGLANVTLIERL